MRPIGEQVIGHRVGYRPVYGAIILDAQKPRQLAKAELSVSVGAGECRGEIR